MNKVLAFLIRAFLVGAAAAVGFAAGDTASLGLNDPTITTIVGTVLGTFAAFLHARISPIETPPPATEK